LAQQGELDEARQEFLEALRLAPGDAAATDNLRKLENLRAH
jgi:Flp pilus assembly protein TadD